MKTPAVTELLFVNDQCIALDSVEGSSYEVGDAASAAALANESMHRSRSGWEFGDVQRLVRSCRHGRYLDYSDTRAIDLDRSIMLEYLTVDRPAEPEHGSPQSVLWLPHIAYQTLGDRLSAVAALLFSAFGHLRNASFLDLFTVELKPVPSKGARHPFRAFVVAGDNDLGLPPAIYEYDSRLHALRALRVSTRAEGVCLQIMVMYEAVHWRYREPAGYRDVFLDLGHVTATLLAVGHSVGLGLVAAPPSIDLPDTPLTEEFVSAFRIEAER